MARRKKSTKVTARPAHPPETRRLSAILLEWAGDFIGVGDLAERQSRLAVASNAWNMACASPIARMRMLDQYMADFQRYNRVPEADAANIRKDILTLVERKSKKFPDDRRQIVQSRVVPKGNSFQLEVVSADIPTRSEP